MSKVDSEKGDPKRIDLDDPMREEFIETLGAAQGDEQRVSSQAAGASTDEFRAMVGEADTEIARLKQAVGWILDAADAAYIEDANNERIHEIFNIAAKVCGITRRLPDENHPFEL